MAVSTDQFWDLLAESQLIEPDRLAELRQEFASFGGAGTQDNAATVAEWLVSQSLIDSYHKRILLDGSAGPFIYGDYIVCGQQQRFGDGRWFTARHRSTNHLIELQFLTGAGAQDPASWQRIITEVQQRAGAVSPYLQRIYEPIDLGSYRLIAYQHHPGRLLSERLASDGPMPLAEACQLTWTIAHGLAELHRRGLVHGAVNPASIRLADDGSCLLLSDAARLDNQLDLVNNPQDPRWEALSDYLAPELGQPKQRTSTTSDVYSLGVCFYEMLSGKPPYLGGSLLQKLQRHAATEFPALAAAGLPANVDRLLAYLVHKTPQHRYPHAGEIPDKLQLLVPSRRLTLTDVAPVASEAAYLTALQNPASQQPAATPKQQQRQPASPLIDVSRSPRTSPSVDTSSKEAAGDSESTETETRQPSRRRRRSRSIANSPVFWGSTGLAGIAAIVLFVIAAGSGDGDGETAGDKGTTVAGKDKDSNTKVKAGSIPRPNNGSKPSVPRPGEATNDPMVVDDDGSLLWQSPTDGSPPALNWLPSGAQVLLFARPADLVAKGGEDLLRALGPAFGKHQAAWEAASGLELSEVRRLTMGLYDNGEEFPRPAFVVELADSIEPAALLEQLGNPEPVQVENGVYYRGADYCYAIPTAADNTLFLMGHEDDVSEAMKFPGRTPPIHPTITPLFKITDGERHLTVLFAPAFLKNNVFRDGRDITIGQPRRIRGILNWLLDENVGAGLISMHIDQQLYLETRLAGGLSRNKFELAEQFQKQMQAVPDKIFDYIVQLNPHRHWRSVAMKYPEMIRFLNDQTRIGVDDGLAMANAALPSVAAANLLVGAELCLVAEPMIQLAGGPTDGADKFTSLDDVLAFTMSLNIPQQDLNLAVADIETEIKDAIGRVSFPFAIAILGDDLKVDGITRNQAIRDFVIKDKPFSEVLTGLMMKANPDPSVKDPSEVNQKLVWVLGPDPNDPENEIILITTRTAALDPERKFKLPAVFK
jgi:serine/threonine protein kinase